MSGSSTTTPPASDDEAKAVPESTPVDEQAQEDAGKVREESGGYD